MALRDNIQQTSFKGVPFFFRDITTTSGQKIVIHEYPNSDRRAVEDLGALPETFDVVGVVSGADYQARVSALKRALKEGGFGRFVHPTQGTFRVKAGTFTLSERDTRLGEAVFTMNFIRATAEVQPTVATSSVSSVASAGERVRTNLKENITDNYRVTSDNFDDAVQQTISIADAFDFAGSKFFQSVAGVSNFQRLVNGFRSQANKLVLSPITLANQLFNLFDAFGLIQVSPRSSFNQLSTLYDFGDDDPAVALDTFSRIERERNRDILRSSVQAGALEESYIEASLIEFTTVDEVDDVAEITGAQFTKVNDTVTDDTRVELNEQRVQTRKVFEGQRLVASQIVSLDLSTRPSAVQAYGIYGSVDLATELNDLNNNRDTGFLGGVATQVLTE